MWWSATCISVCGSLPCVNGCHQAPTEITQKYWLHVPSALFPEKGYRLHNTTVPPITKSTFLHWRKCVEHSVNCATWSIQVIRMNVIKDEKIKNYICIYLKQSMHLQTVFQIAWLPLSIPLYWTIQKHIQTTLLCRIWQLKSGKKQWLQVMFLCGAIPSLISHLKREEKAFFVTI